MTYKIRYCLSALIALFVACSEDQKGAALSSQIFPQGEKNTNDNFIGEVWVKSLVDAENSNETAVGNVTFAPGARSNWHSHPAGQIILATAGTGYYQEKGKPKMILLKGDVIKCPPNLPHWHGASADSTFVQIAITGRQKGPTVWLEAVPDSVYLAK